MQAEKTPEQQASALLDILPRRGPAAFLSFCEALMVSNQDFICKKIDRGFAENWEEQHKANVTTTASQPSDSQQPDASRKGKGITACVRTKCEGVLCGNIIIEM